jgi:DNA (cytosine-5)-methyltransferase 1
MELKMQQTVIELFAGVGGFRLGLEKSGWRTLWANQYEPATKSQSAADCYRHHFPDQKDNPYFNIDISKVTSQLENDKLTIPNHTLLVGGFPCQDYSVASTNAKGLEGKKGVLWWDIEKIIRIKKPPYVLLENVDRLLVSPSKQRGRDFGVLLGCLRDLGYYVEWRVINAADYGFPQKRKRVFIFASRNDTAFSQSFDKSQSPHEILQSKGFFAAEFPVKSEIFDYDSFDNFTYSIQKISDDFAFKFHNAGFMVKNKIYTLKVSPIKTTIKTLHSVLEKNVDSHYFVPDIDIAKARGWMYFKGAKKEQRTAKNGHVYNYAEGAIPFPDKLDTPARTLLTGEGNQNPNRSTHLILDPAIQKYRTLTPIEAERLNGFPNDWTNTGMTKSKRYFCMGNALVIGIVEKIGHRLKEIIKLVE